MFQVLENWNLQGLSHPKVRIGLLSSAHSWAKLITLADASDPPGDELEIELCKVVKYKVNKNPSFAFNAAWTHVYYPSWSIIYIYIAIYKWR